MMTKTESWEILWKLLEKYVASQNLKTIADNKCNKKIKLGKIEAYTDILETMTEMSTQNDKNYEKYEKEIKGA